MSEESEFKTVTYRRPEFLKTDEPENFQFKDVLDFVKYVFRNKVSIWKSMKKERQDQAHVLAVARALTEQNDINLKKRNKTLAEQDQEDDMYKLVGTVDRGALERAAGDGLNAREKGLGERIKLN
jgi:hypothetical protein